jgi:hypothetical protein
MEFRLSEGGAVTLFFAADEVITQVRLNSPNN